MTMRVNGPNNIVVNFPDGTDAQTVNKVMKEALQKSNGIDTSLPPMLSPEQKQTMASQYGMADKIIGGITMGLNDKGSSALSGLFDGGIVDPLMGRGFNVGSRYNEALANRRDAENQYTEQNPVKSGIGTVGGTLLGLKFMPSIGTGMSGVVKTGAAYGAGLGATADANSLGERAQNTISGGVGGAVTAPLVAAGIKYAPAIGRTIAAPLMGYFNPEKMANSVLERAVQKSGQTVPDIQNIINQAGAEGNRGFNTADALGKTGQSLLSTVAKSPNDMQQTISETLLNRQAGQSGRVGGFVKTGLGASGTAKKMESGLTKLRTMVADGNYASARNDGGPVDLSGAINKIDEIVGPTNKYDLGISPDSTEGALLALRKQLASGTIKDGITSRNDFNRILSMKGDLKDTIDSLYASGKSKRASALDNVYKQLDAALADASPSYRNANDTFAQMSRPIDAVGIGKEAARPSSRAADNITTYNSMSKDPVSQIAYKSGYADPLLGRIEASPPGVNTVRPLLADKYQQEFGAMAKDPALLGRQLGRENTMNATMQRALGGSPTAENLLNEAQMSSIDPSALAKIAKNPISGTIGFLLGKGGDILSGKNATVRSLLGERLLSQDPAAFIAALNKSKNISRAKREALIKALSPATGLLGGYTSKNATQYLLH